MSQERNANVFVTCNNVVSADAGTFSVPELAIDLEFQASVLARMILEDAPPSQCALQLGRLRSNLDAMPVAFRGEMQAAVPLRRLRVLQGRESMGAQTDSSPEKSDDNEDVSETADDVKHPTGSEQAEKNKEDDPPA